MILIKVLKINNDICIAKFFGNLKAGDTLVAKIRKSGRTLKQNALYWLFCEYCTSYFGMSAEETHEAFILNFLKINKEINNHIIETTKSTTELSKTEFGEYFDKCNQLAGEMGVDAYDFWKRYEEMIK